MATQEEVTQAVYKYAANLVKAGSSASQVESQLMEKGIDQASASVVVKNVFMFRSKAIQEAAKKDMLYGALWCIGGIVVTLLTYSAASEGGTFIIAWGAIVFGGSQFFRGLLQYSSN